MGYDRILRRQKSIKRFTIVFFLLKEGPDGRAASRPDLVYLIVQFRHLTTI